LSYTYFSIIAATGRKRRRSAIEEQPSQNWKLMLDNEEIDFNEFVAQFKPDPPRAPKGYCTQSFQVQC